MKNRAMILPTALCLFLIVMAAGTGFLMLMSDGYLSASKNGFTHGAYYCAYSGVMYASVKMQEDPAWTAPPQGEVFTIPTGTALVKTAPGPPGTLVVTSEGRYTTEGKVRATSRIQATLGALGIVEWKNLP